MPRQSPDAAEVGCFRLPQLMMAELGNTRVLQHEVMRRRSGAHCQSHNVSQWVPVLQRTVSRCAAPGTRERGVRRTSAMTSRRPAGAVSSSAQIDCARWVGRMGRAERNPSSLKKLSSRDGYRCAPPILRAFVTLCSRVPGAAQRATMRCRTGTHGDTL